MTYTPGRVFADPKMLEEERQMDELLEEVRTAMRRGDHEKVLNELKRVFPDVCFVVIHRNN